MAERMTEEELVSRIRQEINDSLGYGDEIAIQRERAMEYYYSEKFGNEQTGRSTYVSSDVMDTIEWIKPSLMRVFASGDEVCTFNPVGPEDVEISKQATDYVNYVFMRQNPGWEILYSWFTDALLLKNGIVKVWFDESEEWNREEYERLNDVEFEALISQDDVEVLEHSEESEEFEGVVTVSHDVVITRNKSKGQVKVENVPPDEFLIARMSKTIQESPYVCHRVRKTVTELREMGFEIDPEELRAGATDMDDLSGERWARYSYDDTGSVGIWGDRGNSGNDESMWEYWVHESYIRADYDGDGIAEIRKVITIGDTVLENEVVDYIPFISLTPVKIPHKFFGLSVADLIMDLQLIKSTVIRNLLDNMYLANYGRSAVLENQVNMEDLLSQRPGGIVRVKTPNAIMPLPTPALEPHTFGLLEYLDSVRESRAGVSRMSQGLNENALTSHTTATAVNSVMGAAQQRVELIARCFAETGVKDLMRTIYMLLQKNQNKEQVVRLRNQWVSVRPDQWRDELDCTVSVGVGSGNKDQQLMHLSTMMQFASQAMAGGLSIVNEQNLYNMGAAMIKNMGFMNVDDFLTDPAQQPQGEPSPEEMIQQQEMAIKQKELEIKAADVAIKQMKIQQVAASDAVDARLKMEELSLEREQNRAVALG